MVKRKKIIFTIVLAFILIQSFSGIACASSYYMVATEDAVSSASSSSSENDDATTTSDDKDATPPTEDEGGMFERAIALPINAIVTVIEKVEETGEFKTLDKLVFNQGLSKDEMELAPFTQKEWENLNKWYEGMSAATGGFALLVVIITSYRLFWAGAINPRTRQDAIESMWRWLWAVVLIVGAPAVFYLVFQINNGLVASLQTISQNVMNTDTQSLNKLSFNGDGSYIKNLLTGSVLGTAIVKLMFAGIEIFFNVLYVIRRFSLMSMYVFTPLMAWMWAFNKNVMAFPIWIGELMSNAFMQTAHAFCLLLFLTFCDTSDGKSWVTLLIWMYAIIPLSEMFRNTVQGLFTRMSGLDEQGTATKLMAGAFGLAPLMGMGNLFKASGQSMTPGSGGIMNNAQNGNGVSSFGGGIGGQGGMSAIQTPTTTNMPIPSNQNVLASAGSSLGSNIPLGSSLGGTVPTGTVPTGTVNSGGLNMNDTPSMPTSAPIDQPSPVQGLGMVRASQAAGTAARFAGAAGGVMASTMLQSIPGGQNVAEHARRATGAVAASVATVGSIATQTIGRRINGESGQTSLAGAFREVTGGETVGNGIYNTVAQGIRSGTSAYVTGGNVPPPRVQPSLDSNRWRS